MNISLSAFAPENLVSRDGFGSPVPRQPAHLHTQAESGAYLRDSSRVSRRSPFIYYRRTKNDREYSTSTCFFFFILFVRIRKSKWNQTDNLFIFFLRSIQAVLQGAAARNQGFTVCSYERCEVDALQLLLLLPFSHHKFNRQAHITRMTHYRTEYIL